MVAFSKIWGFPHKQKLLVLTNPAELLIILFFPSLVQSVAGIEAQGRKGFIVFSCAGKISISQQKSFTELELSGRNKSRDGLGWDGAQS